MRRARLYDLGEFFGYGGECCVVDGCGVVDFVYFVFCVDFDACLYRLVF